MAKSTLFYTIDEAAKKLGKNAESIRQMVASGQLQEFKDSGGELVLKREAVDMLTSDHDAIPLAMDDDREGISLADDSRSGSGAGTGGAKERSGISIFEGDDDAPVDASAQTLITQSQGDATNMDPSGSGSGLDMTRNEDTSLGGGLLDDVYSDGGGSKADVTAGLGDSQAGNQGLFENSGVASDINSGSPAMALMMAESYDPSWSGIAGGLALSMVLVAGALLTVVILGIMNAGGSVIELFSSNMWAFVGGFGGLTLLLAVAGWMFGRKS